MNCVSIVAIFVLLAPLILASPSHFVPTFNISTTRQRRTVPQCGQFCRFRLCNFNGNSFQLPKAPFILLNAPNEPFAPYICRAGTSIGRITGTREASVADSEGLVPISKWSPPGLRTPFAPRFFGVGNIPLLPWSGVSRAVTENLQWDFLHDRCVVLPVTGFEIIDSDTQRFLRSERVDTSDSANCVAFRTTAPQIHIQLIWDTPDDFDLSVSEPDGDVINFQNTRSEQGKLNGDNNKGFCLSGIPGGKEDIVYFRSRNIEFGTYRVTATHGTKCGNRSSNWTLTIMKNGIIVKRRTGTSNTGGNNRVITTNFRFP